MNERELALENYCSAERKEVEKLLDAVLASPLGQAAQGLLVVADQYVELAYVNRDMSYRLGDFLFVRQGETERRVTYMELTEALIQHDAALYTPGPDLRRPQRIIERVRVRISTVISEVGHAIRSETSAQVRKAQAA